MSTEQAKRIAELEEQNARLVEALKNLDAHLDFGEPMGDNVAITFDNASGINAAFEQARAALAQKERA